MEKINSNTIINNTCTFNYLIDINETNSHKTKLILILHFEI